jgi:hypothetical protein
MSPTLPPGRAAAIPAHNAASASSTSVVSSGPTAPTGTEIAASPCQPSTMAPQSIETRSPSRSSRSPGMPCTTSSFTEVQIEAGKPW